MARSIPRSQRDFCPALRPPFGRSLGRFILDVWARVLLHRSVIVTRRECTACPLSLSARSLPALSRGFSIFISYLTAETKVGVQKAAEEQENPSKRARQRVGNQSMTRKRSYENS